MSADLFQRRLSKDEHRGLHRLLLELCPKLPTDFEPYGRRSRDEDWGPDCSCGCRHFLQLAGVLGTDWGVCANPRSPRAGLLTFEHQGCREFEEDGRIEEEIERLVKEHPDVVRRFNRGEVLARCAWREGLDWDAMSDEERKSFAEKLLGRRARE